MNTTHISPALHHGGHHAHRAPWLSWPGIHTLVRRSDSSVKLSQTDLEMVTQGSIRTVFIQFSYSRLNQNGVHSIQFNSFTQSGHSVVTSPRETLATVPSVLAVSYRNTSNSPAVDHHALNSNSVHFVHATCAFSADLSTWDVWIILLHDCSTAQSSSITV
jgi:hypothetical protein